MTMRTSHGRYSALPLSRVGAAISIIGLAFLSTVSMVHAQESLLDRKLGDDYRYLGQIQPRHARDIDASNWSVGAETMDRDYTIYANWREYGKPGEPLHNDGTNWRETKLFGSWDCAAREIEPYGIAIPPLVEPKRAR